ncbi:MAG: hypothetical protein PHW69_06730 [Elusimicrobiaceae bacterium]|nr:hypothetical protein [Elusimicrobiaceae bacterium]
MLDNVWRNKKLLAFALFNAALFLILSFMRVTLTPDSAGYIGDSFLRAPVYPLLIAFFKLLVPAHFLRAVVIFQTAAVLAAVIGLAAEIRRRFGLSDLFFMLVYLVLLWPLLPFSGGFIGAQIMTEAAAYALFLFAALCLCRGLALKDARWLAAFVCLGCGSVLIKPQFLFMPLSAAAIVAAEYCSARNARRTLVLLGALVLSFGASALFGRVYNYARHGIFKPCPGLGYHAAMNALFLSDDSAAALFSDPAERAAFEDLYGKVKAAGMRAADFGGLGVAAYASFSTGVFNPVVWDIVVPSLAAYCPAGAGADACLLHEDALGMKIAKKILMHRPAAYIKLLVYKLLAGTPLYYWFFIMAVFWLSGWLFMVRGSARAGLLFCAILMNLVNYAGVGSFTPFMLRLTFHAEFLHAAVLLAALWACFSLAQKQADP